ncbi:MAG: nucleotidyltransferase domain-containing protein [Pseudomonadales bacterium]|nr:nucleotidyltransferase domain-containing protein [Pseudomonadales bacterium]
MGNVIESLKQLAIAEHDIALIWLYGSRAQGSHIENSDYDIAIAFNDFSLPRNDRILRAQCLAEKWQSTLNLPEGQLSIIDINLAPIYLCQSVIDKGKLFVEKDNYRLIKEYSRIWSEFEHLNFEQQLSQKLN